MSRRDTIIVAVLVNVGLLVVLFVTAMRDGKEVKEVAAGTEQVQEFAAGPKDAAGVEVADAKQEGQAEESGFDRESPVDAVDQALAAGSTTAIPLAVQTADGMAESTEPLNLEPSAVQLADADKEPLDIVKEPLEEEKVAKVEKAEKYVEVKVKRGDALQKIAKANGTTVDAIMKANKLRSTQLKIGQVLKVPAQQKGSSQVAKAAKSTSKPVAKAVSDKASSKIASASKSAPKAKAKSSSNSQYYTIQKGDNLWSIASKNGVKLDDILRLNGLDEAKARKLKAGDEIRIR